MKTNTTTQTNGSAQPNQPVDPNTASGLPDNPGFRPFMILRANGWSLARIAEKVGVSKSTLHRWDLEYQNELYWFKFARVEEIQDRHIPSYENQLQRLAQYLQRIEAVLEKRDLEQMSTAALLNQALKVRATFHRLRKDVALHSPPFNTPLEPFPYTSCISHLEDNSSPDPMARLPDELASSSAPATNGKVPKPAEGYGRVRKPSPDAAELKQPTPPERCTAAPPEAPEPSVPFADASPDRAPDRTWDENTKSESSHPLNTNGLHQSARDDRPITPSRPKPLRHIPPSGASPVRKRPPSCPATGQSQTGDQPVTAHPAKNGHVAPPPPNSEDTSGD